MNVKIVRSDRADSEYTTFCSGDSLVIEGVKIPLRQVTINFISPHNIELVITGDSLKVDSNKGITFLK